jgi:hypothetical protein
MLSKRFVPILLALLLVPAASSTAAPATPSPAPSVAPSVEAASPTTLLVPHQSLGD